MLSLLTIVSALLSVFAISESAQIYHTSKVPSAESYSSTSHHVVTKDGYILELHRITDGRQPGSPRPVVFLMHGLVGASNSYTFLGPKKSLAYLLADVGYDVWMGNARGNRFSRRHVSLDPDGDKLRFFDFSFEEIATMDLPAMFDYVLGQTKQEKFHYIGHSQGGTVFLVLNSMTNEYHSKIASAHLLAGVGYMAHFPSPDLRLMALSADLIYNTMRLAGNVELFPPGATGIFGRSDSASIFTNLPRILDIDPTSELVAGAALKQVAHFAQNIRDRIFRRWDFGPLQNLSKYRSVSPPRYDLSRINIDVTFHYSLNDTLLSERDSIDMANALPKARARKVARDSFTHMDYITADDARELVLDYIIESLKKS